MLYGLLVALLVIVCFLLIMVILIQQGKGGIGLGSSFGAAQMLFGGSGGQDIFQKITWTLGTIFMLGSLGLFLMGAKNTDYANYLNKNKFAQRPMQMPVAPTGDTAKTGVPAQAPVSSSGDAAQMPAMPVDNVAKTDASAVQTPVTPVQTPVAPVDNAAKN